MRNKELYKSMLAAVQNISEATKEKTFNQELVQSLAETAAPIIQFFSLTLEEAIVLCYCIDANLKDQTVNKESITTHFGKDITALADVDEYIEGLAKKKLVFLSNKDRKFKRQFKYVHLNPKVPAAMAEGDASLLGLPYCQIFSDFLMEVNDLIVLRISEHISSQELFMEVSQLIDNCKSLKEIKWLRKQKKLKGYELLVFLNICVEQGDGEDEIDIDKIINEVIDHPSEKMKIKQAIKGERSVLFKENYIVHCGNIFGMMNLVQLSDETLDHLMQYMKSEQKKEFNPRMGTLINSEKIAEEQLFYNDREHQQISTLKNALQEENYKLLVDRMRKHNMLPGFTALLYGLPGVGKTATVKAIARETGRHIFMVDIPKINSKWVGESEKNLSRLFDEYRRAKKLYSKQPILLFNEADAIIGKRIEANSSVDKMNNSLQNILLQELEDFEGIFMATTNMANQICGSFDRRFLFKLEFKNPEDHIRLEILQNAFPNLDEDLLNHINQDFPLTGGQIANIKKKILVKEMLESNFDIEPALFSLCEDEFSLRKNGNRPTIGFVTHRRAS